MATMNGTRIRPSRSRGTKKLKSCQGERPWFLIPSIFGKNSAAAAVAVAKSQSVERGDDGEGLGNATGHR